MPRAPSSVVSLVCQPTILYRGHRGCSRVPPCQACLLCMATPGRAHGSTIRMEETVGLLTPLGEDLQPLPGGRAQLIALSHSPHQQHFDGRAQDSGESPSSQTTWVHFLSLAHLSISFDHQATASYSFPEWGLFSPPFTFQPMFFKHLSDLDLVWILPMVERVVRGGTLRYYMVISDFTVIRPWAWGLVSSL